MSYSEHDARVIRADLERQSEHYARTDGWDPQGDDHLPRIGGPNLAHVLKHYSDLLTELEPEPTFDTVEEDRGER